MGRRKKGSDKAGKKKAATGGDHGDDGAVTARAAWLGILGGAVLGGLSFRPFGLWFLLPLTPVLFFFGARSARTPLRAALRLLAAGWIYHLIVISWLFTTGRYHPFAYIGVFLLAGYMAVYPALAGWIARRWFGALPVPWQFGVFAALWLLGEWFRTLGRLTMPFGQLAHAWAPVAPLIQLAEFSGEAAVSAQILLFSALIVSILALPSLRARRPVVALLGRVSEFSRAGGARAKLCVAGLAAACALLVGVSAIRLRQWDARVAAEADADRVSVAIVQPNIDQETKLASYADPDDELRERLQESSNMLHEGLVLEQCPPQTDLVLMPESTYSDIGFRYQTDLHRRIERMMEPIRADLVFGACRITVTDDYDLDEAFNSAWYLPMDRRLDAGPEGQPDPGLIQDKMRLVPFGEAIPYFDLIPFVEEIFGLGSFDEGIEVRTFTLTRGPKFGVLICFESTFGAQARKLVARGAEFIVVITNDAWYGMSAGPGQHHDLSLLRAVETRRPVLRSANTGISSIITPNGRIWASLPLGTQGVLADRFAPRSEITHYQRFGSLWLLLGCVAFVASSFIAALKKSADAPV